MSGHSHWPAVNDEASDKGDAVIANGEDTNNNQCSSTVEESCEQTVGELTEQNRHSKCLERELITTEDSYKQKSDSENNTVVLNRTHYVPTLRDSDNREKILYVCSSSVNSTIDSQLHVTHHGSVSPFPEACYQEIGEHPNSLHKLPNVPALAGIPGPVVSGDQIIYPVKFDTKVGRKRKHPAPPGKHVCPYCGRGCAKPSVLQKHVRAHTGERPYPCRTCGFAFKTKSNLYKHCKSQSHALKAGQGDDCKDATNSGDSLDNDNTESGGSSSTEICEIEDTEARQAEMVTVSKEMTSEPARAEQSVRDKHYSDTNQYSGVDTAVPVPVAGLSVSQPVVFTALSPVLHDKYLALKNTFYTSHPQFSPGNVPATLQIADQLGSTSFCQQQPLMTAISSHSEQSHSVNGLPISVQSTKMHSAKTPSSIAPLYNKHLLVEMQNKPADINDTKFSVPVHPTCMSSVTASHHIVHAPHSYNHMADRLISSQETAYLPPFRISPKDQTVSDIVRTRMALPNFSERQHIFCGTTGHQTWNLPMPSSALAKRRQKIQQSHERGKGLAEIASNDPVCNDISPWHASNHFSPNRLPQSVAVSSPRVINNEGRVGAGHYVMEMTKQKLPVDNVNKSVNSETLRDRISKLISENDAVVGTFEPVWFRKHARNKVIGFSEDPKYRSDLSQENPSDVPFSRSISVDEDLKKPHIAVGNNYSGGKIMEENSLITDEPHNANCSQSSANKNTSAGIKDLLSSINKARSENIDRASIKELLMPHSGYVEHSPSSSEVSMIRDLLLRGRSLNIEQVNSCTESVKLITGDVLDMFHCTACGTPFQHAEAFETHVKYYCGSSAKPEEQSKSVLVLKDNSLEKHETMSAAMQQDDSIKNHDTPLSNCIPASNSANGLVLSPKVVFSKELGICEAEGEMSSNKKLSCLRHNQELSYPESIQSLILFQHPKPKTETIVQLKQGKASRLDNSCEDLKSQHLGMMASLNDCKSLSPKVKCAPDEKCLPLGDPNVEVSARVPSSHSQTVLTSTVLREQVPFPDEKKREIEIPCTKSENMPPLKKRKVPDEVWSLSQNKSTSVANISIPEVRVIDETVTTTVDSHSRPVRPTGLHLNFKDPLLKSHVVQLGHPLSVSESLSDITCNTAQPVRQAQITSLVAPFTIVDQKSTKMMADYKLVPNVSFPMVKLVEASPTTPLKPFSINKSFLQATTPEKEIASGFSSPRRVNQKSFLEATTPEKEISPGFPSRKEKILIPLFLYGHNYPSLCGATHTTFCSARQPQPMYVQQKSHKISMYSNWRIIPHSPNMEFLPLVMLSLYNSQVNNVKKGLLYTTAYAEKSGIQTHSSYWFYKANQSQRHVDSSADDMVNEEALDNAETNDDYASLSSGSGSDLSSIRRVPIFTGGYKSNEEYIYVRGRGRGKYVCEECGIRCKKPSMLKKHIRTHTDIRPYSCVHCNFKFKTKGNLTKHMKSKAHNKKCLELNIIPVPITVDDSQIDHEAVARQEEEEAGLLTGESENEDDCSDDGDDMSVDGDDTEYSDVAGRAPCSQASPASLDRQSLTLGEMSDKMWFDGYYGHIMSAKLSQPLQAGKDRVVLDAMSQVDHTDREVAHSLLDLSAQQKPKCITKQENLGCSTLNDSHKQVLNFLGVPLITVRPSNNILSPEDVSKVAYSVGEISTSTRNSENTDVTSCDLSKVSPSSECSESGLANCSQPASIGKMNRLDSVIGAIKSMRQGQVRSHSSDVLSDREHMSAASIAHKGLSLLEKEKTLFPNKANRSNENCCDDVSLKQQTLVRPTDRAQLSLPLRKRTTSLNIQLMCENDIPNNNNASKPTLILPHHALSSSFSEGLIPKIVKQETEELDQSSNDDSLDGTTDNRVIHSSISTPEWMPPDLRKVIAVGMPRRERDESSLTKAELLLAKEMLPIPGKVHDNEREGKCICDVCHKEFQKPSQLRLHFNIHFFERPYRCDNCAVSFRTKGHLQKHQRSESHLNKLTRNLAFGAPTSENPRPFKCTDCKVAFRIHGHLAKHLRSKLHITMLERMGKLPSGTYAQIERFGAVASIDTTDCENSLDSLQHMIQKHADTVGQSDSDGELDYVLDMSTARRKRNDSECSYLSDGVPYDENDESDITNVDQVGEHSMKDNPQNRLLFCPACQIDFSTESQFLTHVRHVHSSSEDQNTSAENQEQVCKSSANEAVSSTKEAISETEIATETFFHRKFRRSACFSEGSSTSVSTQQLEPPKTFVSSDIELAAAADFKCELCGKLTQNQSDLKQHLSTHVALRPYVCDYCDAGFTKHNALLSHLKLHSEHRDTLTTLPDASKSPS